MASVALEKDVPVDSPHQSHTSPAQQRRKTGHRGRQCDQPQRATPPIRGTSRTRLASAAGARSRRGALAQRSIEAAVEIVRASGVCGVGAQVIRVGSNGDGTVQLEAAGPITCLRMDIFKTIVGHSNSLSRNARQAGHTLQTTLLDGLTRVARRMIVRRERYLCLLQDRTDTRTVDVTA